MHTLNVEVDQHVACSVSPCDVMLACLIKYSLTALEIDSFILLGDFEALLSDDFYDSSNFFGVNYAAFCGCLTMHIVLNYMIKGS